MASLGWWFLVRGRSLNTWGLLGAAGCVVAVVDPMSPLQLGAQLSFAATAALISLKGRHLALRVPFRAQWATLPWNVHDFQTFPLLFYPANLLAALAVWVLACCVAGAGLGVGWFMRVLESMGEFTLSLAEEGQLLGRVDLECGVDRPCRARSACLGTGFVVGVSAASRDITGRTLGQTCDGCVGVDGRLGDLECQRHHLQREPPHRLWHVSARTPTWMMEDGWRGEVWTSSSRDSVKATH